ncbi:sigma-54-dependent Fis family transcriptional regulator [Planctomycetales bacterium]|nr:sigma-54-dependent Fis family transcriptional regulator [Planctomycetales bacterium]
MSESPYSILVVDDDENHAEVAAECLEKIGAVCTIAHSQAEASKYIKEKVAGFDVIITDLMLERQDSGLEILKQAKTETEETEVIVVTGHNSVEVAVEAMRQGAFNYLQKPLDLKQLRTITERAAESSRLRSTNRELKLRLDEKFGFNGVLGNSPQMLAVIERLKRVAPTDATVLIQGETGTGKELVAQSIHQNSPRKNKPFVALNCGGLTENILESELFGHIKGAFTDAVSDRIGKFEYADGGTIFLDEVGDMPLSMQVKILRTLENKQITRVGANQAVSVDVRVLSATNRNLEEAVKLGTFREDLYHRLKVITVRVPPLRERKGDIPVLLQHFIKQFSERYGKRIKGITPNVRKILLDYDWHGNVRQLRNIAESMTVVDYDSLIDIDDLPEEFDGLTAALTTSSEKHTEKYTEKYETEHILSSADWKTEDEPKQGLQAFVGKPLSELEKKFIAETLTYANGSRKETAHLLGISERTLYRKIEEYGI